MCGRSAEASRADERPMPPGRARGGEPWRPGGDCVRGKERPAKDGPNGDGAQGTSSTESRPTAGGYRRAEQPASGTPDHASVKVHVGRCKGLELRDLSPEQVQALVTNWLPTAKANAKPTADDRRMIAALDWWLSSQPAAEEDNVQY